MTPTFLRSVEKSAKVFTFYVKIPQSFYVLRKISLSLFILHSSFLIAASAASPFAVSAARDAFDGQPAVRVSFDFPADHHLYSSFSVATPAGDALARTYPGYEPLAALRDDVVRVLDGQPLPSKTAKAP